MPEEKRRNKGRMELEKLPATTAVAKKVIKKLKRATQILCIYHLFFILCSRLKIPTANRFFCYSSNSANNQLRGSNEPLLKT